MEVPEFRPRGTVRWTVESAGVQLFDSATGAVCTLGYPEAAVWDLMVRGRSRPAIVSLMRPIASLDPRHAESLVSGLLIEWCARGFLEREDAPG
jgi:hypothetical protein